MRVREYELAANYREDIASIRSSLHDLVPPDVAEDIAQEAVLAMISRDGYRDALGTQRSYLRGIARHKAIDWLRATYSAEARDRRYATITIDLTDNPADLVCAADEAVRVRRALDTLAPDQRKAISLAYFHGLTYRQVATVLDAPEGTIKTTIRAGLRQLRQQLAVAAV